MWKRFRKRLSEVVPEEYMDFVLGDRLCVNFFKKPVENFNKIIDTIRTKVDLILRKEAFDKVLREMQLLPVEPFYTNYLKGGVDCEETIRNIKSSNPNLSLDDFIRYRKKVHRQKVKDTVQIDDTILEFCNSGDQEVIMKLTNIEILKLTCNSKITDDVFPYLSKLKALDLYFNEKITDNGLKKLSSLTNLGICEDNLITNDGILNLTNLEALDISAHRLITNEGIQNLINLKSLDVSYNKCITDIGISHLTNLNVLKLVEYSMITPKGLDNLINLTILNIKDNKKFNLKEISTEVKSRIEIKTGSYG
ncbi:MAG: hypothetical protein Hyperionvirus4_61 [Hyperionvirus sp.]|uniref:Leucine-rich repeat protein n=1 Tax=Hyperionvirus sp. TaxID=2487770 RepID=A0A3G5A778_9VIRU|nr:MAG: hypothetical protein Hyperionvirus4_61 [Hyperionvirus sp.]